MVPDDQLREDSGTAIADNLCYPAGTEAEQRMALDHGRWQIEMILDRHPGFVGGIGRLSEVPGVRLYYTFGNHDHALAAHPLQVHVRDTLNSLGAHIDGARTMVFGHWFRNEPTRSYGRAWTPVRRERLALPRRGRSVETVARLLLPALRVEPAAGAVRIP